MAYDLKALGLNGLGLRAISALQRQVMESNLGSFECLDLVIIQHKLRTRQSKILTRDLQERPNGAFVFLSIWKADQVHFESPSRRPKDTLTSAVIGTTRNSVRASRFCLAWQD